MEKEGRGAGGFEGSSRMRLEVPALHDHGLQATSSALGSQNKRVLFIPYPQCITITTDYLSSPGDKTS